MKKALRKNFYMEIRHSLGRFLSIFFIVAIGCAFFSGIRASEPDMRYSGDAYFDEKNLMDIQVMSTMGLTEDDLDAIRAVDGVLDAEGSYATDVLCTIQGNQVAVHVMALQNKMNQVQLEDGRLPEKENECVIDADYLDGKNLKIGDRITLSSGTSDSLEDTLKTDTFTIVGTVSSPEYIAFHRGSTTIGNGSVSAFLCVPEKAFSLDVYTEITVQIEGAKEATAFTKEYEEHVDSVLKKVQAIKAEREQARYDEIFNSVLACDLLVLATPIYSWYCTPPMKAVLDRLVYGMNKYYGREKGPSLWEGKPVALIATCGYPVEKGADLWEAGMQRYCKHSRLRLLGMLAQRHRGYDTVFMDPEKARLAAEFARKVNESI